MNSRTFFIISLLLLGIAGCYAAKPTVHIEEGVSLSGYNEFEVLPVSNDTGKTFEFNVSDELTQQIKSQIQEKGYLLYEGEETKDNVLVIKSSLITYEPGNAAERWIMPGAGKTQAYVKTSLLDKRSGEIVGEMLTVEDVAGGGLFSIGADKWILEVVAKGIANEIEKMMKVD